MRDTGNRIYIRINKKEARNRYNRGDTVYMLSCNMRVDNLWCKPYIMDVYKKYDYDTFDEEPADFDKLVNHFEYYNCDYERGYYASFYK